MSSYRIASFNVRDFAFPGKDGRGQILARNVAKFIKDYKIDIIALQELQNEQAKNAILKNLNSTTRIEEQNDKYSDDFQWKGVFNLSTTRYSYKEGYCYIWNSRRLKLISQKRDGSSLLNPQIIGGAKHFVRPPLYVRFVPNDIKVNFEIRLVNVHLRYGLTSDDKNQEITEGAIIKRREEFKALLKLYENNKIDFPEAGENITPYTIILGDYNLCLSSSKEYDCDGPFINTSKNVVNYESYQINAYVGKRGHEKDKLITTTQKELTTLKDPSRSQKENETETTEIYSHNFDHFTLDTNKYGAIQTNAIKRVNLIHKKHGNYKWDDVKEYRKNYSDHLPIIFDFEPRLKKEEIKE